ncbi:MAG: cupin domain-containing protein [Nannocystales bacterium]
MSPRATLTPEELLAPLSVESFVETHLEKQPLHSAGAADRFAGLVSLDDVEDLLARGFFSDAESYGIFRNGERIPPPLFRATPGFGRRQRDGAIASWVRERHLSGDTAAAYAVDTQFRPLGRLARDLAQAFRARVDIGLYLTPKHAQGLGRHWDYMDVFILQVEGRKRWRLFGQAEQLPMRPRETTYEQSKGTQEATADHLLTPGDMLYLPRGAVHEVRTEGVQSLHLTIGVHRLQWHELLAETVREVAQSDPELRRSVSLDPKGRAEQAERLLRRCADVLDPDALAALYERSTIADVALSDRQLDTAMAQETTVDDETRVIKRAGVQCALESTGDHVLLRWPGSEPGATIRAPRQVSSALRFIADASGPFSVGELPGAVTPKSKRVLVRRLIRAGVLKPAVGRESGAAGYASSSARTGSGYPETR